MYIAFTLIPFQFKIITEQPPVAMVMFNEDGLCGLQCCTDVLRNGRYEVIEMLLQIISKPG